MKKLVLWASAALALSVSVFAASKQSEEIRLVAPAEGATVPLLRPLQKEWMSMSREARVAATKDVKGWRRRMTDPALGGNHPLPVRLAWQCAHPDGRACSGPYAVEVMQRCTGQRFFSAENLKTNAVEVWNLEVGEEYTWCVWCGKEVRGGKFFTEDQAPRVLKWEGVGNVRDHGGWKTLDGARVRQGVAYRSAGLNDNALTFLTEEETLALHKAGQLEALFGEKGREVAELIDGGKLEKHDWRLRKMLVRKECQKGKLRGTEESRRHVRKFFGIRTDLDLRRTESECWGMEGSPLGPKVAWANIPSCAYRGMGSPDGKAAFAACFRQFLNPAKYGIVYHCIGGADRTGSLAFVLNGLVGVGEEDLWRDWEFTNFGGQRSRFDHEHCLDGLLKVIDAYPGETVNARIEAFVRDCGITDAEIARFRSLVLDRGGKPTNLEGLPRWQAAEGLGNLRDLGGWKGCGGRRVKTGRVFRSERLDKITDRGRDRLVRELGVRTDLDLRTPESVAKLKGVSPLGKAVRYSNQSSGSYAGFDTEGGRKNFAETFRWFLNEAEYPVVFHCEKGADRTGSWAFLLNGLLGVSERDLRFDWEVTSSFNANPQFKHRGRYDELVKLVNRRTGKTFTDRVVAYAHDCGITDREIAKWRKMMLEEATLKVGVLSDTHLRLESNSNALGDAFGEFKRRGVDVIVIAGDLVEDGRRAEYELFLKTWTDVFGAKPGKDGAPGLFIAWGNHDYRAASKFRNRTFTPAEADEFMLAHKDEVWRAFFDEPFPGEVYMRTYKGVPFVGAHWRHEDELGPWLKAHAAEIDASKFFVCVHHPHASGTVFGGVKTHCEQLRNDLAAYPNGFSISGHSHRSLANDAALWQGPFTAMGAGTLRETGDGKTKPKTRQGAVMSVYPDRVVVSRLDFISRRPLGPDWELPLKTSVLPQAAVQEKR